MTWIAGQCRPDGPHDCPARPGAPAAQFAAGLIHTAGVVLKMHPRIAQEYRLGRMSDKPANRRVRQRPGLKDGLIALQLCTECPVQTENGTGGKTALPKRVRVFQAGQVEIRPAVLISELTQQFPVKGGTRRGQIRTGRERRHDGAFGGPEPSLGQRISFRTLRLARAADSLKTLHPEFLVVLHPRPQGVRPCRDGLASRAHVAAGKTSAVVGNDAALRHDGGGCAPLLEG